VKHISATATNKLTSATVSVTRQGIGGSHFSLLKPKNWFPHGLDAISGQGAGNAPGRLFDDEIGERLAESRQGIYHPHQSIANPHQAIANPDQGISHLRRDGQRLKSLMAGSIFLVAGGAAGNDQAADRGALVVSHVVG
jgi:hypothetical protein